MTIAFLCLHSGKYGMYKANCGLHNVLMSYGHDEYLYQVLVGNDCKLPDPALYIVRLGVGIAELAPPH